MVKLESIVGLILGVLPRQSLVMHYNSLRIDAWRGIVHRSASVQTCRPASVSWFYYTRSMKQNNEIRHGRHCVFLMHVHLVFVTKYRREVFTKTILDELRLIFAAVCKDFESELVEFDGEDDYVHLLVNYPPKVAISMLVNSLKGVSSRMIRKKNYPSITKRLWGGALWSPSYFAGSCGGAPIAIIRQYIEQQQTPH